MDLEFSEDESELRDNVRIVLGDLCPPSLVRSIYEGKGTGNVLWERMVELYWPALAIDEELGGLGMGFLEVAIVAEELGRAVAPGPFLATVTQFVPAVGELGSPEHQSRFVAPVAAAGRTGTLAIAEKGRWDATAIETVARRSGDGWVLDGKKTTVLDGDCADDIVVIARADDTAGLGAFVVEGSAVKAQARTVIDPTLRIADLLLSAVPVPPDRVLAEPGSPGVARALERVIQQATVAMAVSTVGTCRKIFELTLDYAKVREQYGRPIGSFQALKHRLAEMYLAVERASSLCYFAALTVAEDDARRAEAAALAKSATGDCQRLLAQDGLQLHGGVGFTWEHDLHFFLKRAKSGEAMFGTAASHRAALARSLGLVGTGFGPERG